MCDKRVFNLLRGVNQGSGLLLARGLEKREPVQCSAVALVNTLEKIECSLRAWVYFDFPFSTPPWFSVV